MHSSNYNYHNSNSSSSNHNNNNKGNDIASIVMEKLRELHPDMPSTLPPPMDGKLFDVKANILRLESERIYEPYTIESDKKDVPYDPKIVPRSNHQEMETEEQQCKILLGIYSLTKSSYFVPRSCFLNRSQRCRNRSIGKK
jgi:hypothetical protein